jgi:hypothetical protein
VETREVLRRATLKFTVHLRITFDIECRSLFEDPNESDAFLQLKLVDVLVVKLQEALKPLLLADPWRLADECGA